MLQINQLIGFGAGGAGVAGPTVSYVGVVSSPTNGSVFTFSSASIGSAASNRHVIVTIGLQHTSDRTISSVTVAGQSCSSVVSELSSNKTSLAIYITDSPVTTGTTGDVVVTTNSSCNACGVGIFAAYGLASATAVNTASTTTDNATMALTATVGGFAVSVCGVNADATFTQTGTTEQHDTTAEAGLLCFTSGTMTPTGTSLNVAIDASDLTEYGAACASFY